MSILLKMGGILLVSLERRARPKKTSYPYRSLAIRGDAPRWLEANWMGTRRFGPLLPFMWVCRF